MQQNIKISQLPASETLDGFSALGVSVDNTTVKVDMSFVQQAADNATAAASSALTATEDAITATTATTQATTLTKAATESANTATTAANTAASLANTAAGTANTAASNADSKATLANTATNAANTAASNANSKATLANTAAGTANTAANNAQEQAIDARSTIVRLKELEEALVGQYKMIPTGMTLDYPRVLTMRNTERHVVKYALTPTDTGRNVLFIGDNNAVSIFPDGGFNINKPGISKIHVIPTENTTIYETIQITVVEPALRKVRANSLRFDGSGNIRLT